MIKVITSSENHNHIPVFTLSNGWFLKPIKMSGSRKVPQESQVHIPNYDFCTYLFCYVILGLSLSPARLVKALKCAEGKM